MDEAFFVNDLADEAICVLVDRNLFTVTPYRRFRLHGCACGNEDGEDALK